VIFFLLHTKFRGLILNPQVVRETWVGVRRALKCITLQGK